MSNKYRNFPVPNKELARVLIFKSLNLKRILLKPSTKFFLWYKNVAMIIISILLTNRVYSTVRVKFQKTTDCFVGLSISANLWIKKLRTIELFILQGTAVVPFGPIIKYPCPWATWSCSPTPIGYTNTISLSLSPRSLQYIYETRNEL